MNINTGTINTKPFTNEVIYTREQKQAIQTRISERFSMQLLQGLIDLLHEHEDAKGFKNSDSYLAAKGLITHIEKEYESTVNSKLGA